MTTYRSPLRLFQLSIWPAALAAVSLGAACGEDATDGTGTYYGYYRGPARSTELPTPTGTAPPAASGAGGSSGDGYFDAGAMAGQGGGMLADAGGDPMNGASGMDSPMGDEGVCNAPETVLTLRCNGGVCHGSGSDFGDFAVSAAQAETYVGEEANSSQCGLIIDPDSPEDSLLLTKTTGDQPAGCGSAMPLGGTPLSATEIECIESWISQF